jgi:hypothetical protein
MSGQMGVVAGFLIRCLGQGKRGGSVAAGRWRSRGLLIGRIMGTGSAIGRGGIAGGFTGGRLPGGRRRQINRRLGFWVILSLPRGFSGPGLIGGGLRV